MYTQKNPYLSTLASSSSKPASSRAPPPAEKPKDGVLSRVPKRPGVEKPPVKFSMAPRYRFALPEPPTDLNMLRGALRVPDAAARAASRLELDARRVAAPAHPSFGMRADLVAPAVPADGAPRAHLTSDDHVLLDAVDAAAGGRSSALLAAAETAAAAPRRAMPPPKRAKAPTAFPWMRRMSYDEYFSGTGNDRRSSIATTGANKANDEKKRMKAREQRKLERAETFRKARMRSFSHPDKGKSHLKIVSVTPVFRNPEDVYRDFVSMQFDRMGPTEAIPRFASDPVRGEKAFESAVTISLADEEDRKFLSCFVPDDETLDDIQDLPHDARRDGKEMHNRLREFSIREASQVVQPAKGQAQRMKRTFVMTQAGEGNRAVVGLSDLPSAFLLTPRQGIQNPLADATLELTRDPLTPMVKRVRVEAVVDQLCEKL